MCGHNVTIKVETVKTLTVSYSLYNQQIRIDRYRLCVIPFRTRILKTKKKHSCCNRKFLVDTKLFHLKKYTLWYYRYYQIFWSLHFQHGTINSSLAAFRRQKKTSPSNAVPRWFLGVEGRAELFA